LINPPIIFLPPDRVKDKIWDTPSDLSFRESPSSHLGFVLHPGATMIVCGSSPERDPRLAVHSYNLEKPHWICLPCGLPQPKSKAVESQNWLPHATMAR